MIHGSGLRGSASHHIGQRKHCPSDVTEHHRCHKRLKSNLTSISQKVLLVQACDYPLFTNIAQTAELSVIRSITLGLNTSREDSQQSYDFFTVVLTGDPANTRTNWRLNVPNRISRSSRIPIMSNYALWDGRLAPHINPLGPKFLSSCRWLSRQSSSTRI